jgi:hypothetical protein
LSERYLCDQGYPTAPQLGTAGEYTNGVIIREGMRKQLEKREG